MELGVARRLRSAQHAGSADKLERTRSEEEAQIALETDDAKPS
jgi:hypothetical protein